MTDVPPITDDPIEQTEQAARDARRPAPWLNPTLLLAWIAIYLVAMWLSDWKFDAPQGAPGVVAVFAYGMPEAQAQNRTGAPVPALMLDGEYHRAMLSSLMNQSLISLIFSLWIWFGIGRLLIGTVGPSRTWLTFVGGGIAVAIGYAIDQPDARTATSGSWGPWMGALGVMAVYGFLNKGMLAQAFRKQVLRTLFWIVLLGVIFSLLVGAPITVEGVFSPATLGAGLLGGIVLGFLFGPRRMMTPAGTVTRITAIALGLATVAAIVFVAPDVFGSTAPQHVQKHLTGLGELDKLARDVFDDGLAASQPDRLKIGQLRAELLAQDWLKDREELRAALEAYLELYDHLIQANVPDPHGLRLALKRRFEAYEEHEVRLRLVYGMQERPVNYWERK